MHVVTAILALALASAAWAESPLVTELRVSAELPREPATHRHAPGRPRQRGEERSGRGHAARAGARLLHLGRRAREDAGGEARGLRAGPAGRQARRRAGAEERARPLLVRHQHRPLGADQGRGALALPASDRQAGDGDGARDRPDLRSGLCPGRQRLQRGAGASSAGTSTVGEQMFRKGLALDPRFTDMRVGLARTLIKKGRMAEARRGALAVLDEKAPTISPTGP